MWLEGWWDDDRAAWPDATVEHVDELTRIVGVLDRDALYALLADVHACGVDVLGVRRNADLMLLPRRRRMWAREYAIRFEGPVEHEALRVALDVGVAYDGAATVVTRCFGAHALADVLRRAAAMGGDLVAIVSLS